MRNGFKKTVAALSAAMMMTTGFAAFANGEQENTVDLMSKHSGIVYTGKEQTPSIQLFDGELELVQGTDYDLSYENNVNVGTATIIVTFKGNYSGTKRVNFQILARELSNADVSISGVESSYVFEDKAIEPKPTVKVGDVTLTEGTDYDLSYSDNTGTGTATITINFKGNYSGTASTNFEITAKDLTSDNALTCSAIPTQTYTGNPIEPKPEIKYDDKVLSEGVDYTLGYENNTNIGNATVNVTFIGNYTGEEEYPFVIQAREATADNTVISNIESSYMYTGNAITPEPTIAVDGRTLTKDTDYILTYENNTNVGTATVKVEFKGNYSGQTSVDFEITPFIITDANVHISDIADQTYTGSEITPEITITVIR